MPSMGSRGPDKLLLDHVDLLEKHVFRYPALDLACGDGHNGLFLASRGFTVILADRSAASLKIAGATARDLNLPVVLWEVDFEEDASSPLEDRKFGSVLVFRYLLRPLIPEIRESLLPGGILIYETFTEGQSRYGRPKNPDHLARKGEMMEWFGDWEIIHYFEGLKEEPRREIVQIVCRK